VASGNNVSTNGYVRFLRVPAFSEQLRLGSALRAAPTGVREPRDGGVQLLSTEALGQQEHGGLGGGHEVFFDHLRSLPALLDDPYRLVQSVGKIKSTAPA